MKGTYSWGDAMKINARGHYSKLKKETESEVKGSCLQVSVVIRQKYTNNRSGMVSSAQKQVK